MAIRNDRHLQQRYHSEALQKFVVLDESAELECGEAGVQCRTGGKVNERCLILKKGGVLYVMQESQLAQTAQSDRAENCGESGVKEGGEGLLPLNWSKKLDMSEMILGSSGGRMLLPRKYWDSGGPPSKDEGCQSWSNLEDIELGLRLELHHNFKSFQAGKVSFCGDNEAKRVGIDVEINIPPAVGMPGQPSKVSELLQRDVSIAILDHKIGVFMAIWCHREHTLCFLAVVFLVVSFKLVWCPRNDSSKVRRLQRQSAGAYDITKMALLRRVGKEIQIRDEGILPARIAEGWEDMEDRGEKRF
ncbi:hypothetical protein FB451DRAFT_1455453 [Mycena latifolia]|nr:hypothetical protein FB451DRAFT_1455453 [Mycena latifolia]